MCRDLYEAREGDGCVLLAEVERLTEERDTEAGIRIRAVEQMVRYRKALEHIGWGHSPQGQREPRDGWKAEVARDALDDDR